MKKLIMCVSAVLSACALNAATVNWGITDLYDENFESLVGTITLTSGSVSSGPVAIDGGVVSGSFDGVTWGTDPFATGSAWQMTAKVQDANGDWYEQVFDVALGTIDASDDRANAAAFDQLAYDSYIAMIPGGILDTSDLTSQGWTKSGGVPEPTSGLLLVLGGAMLALRRRRA